MKTTVTANAHSPARHRMFDLKNGVSVTDDVVSLRSAADHRGGSGLPEAWVPPHPQRQGPVRSRQGGGGVLHPRHLSRDVQALTASSEPQICDKLWQTTKIKISPNICLPLSVLVSFQNKIQVALKAPVSLFVLPTSSETSTHTHACGLTRPLCVSSCSTSTESS